MTRTVGLIWAGAAVVATACSDDAGGGADATSDSTAASSSTVTPGDDDGADDGGDEPISTTGGPNTTSGGSTTGVDPDSTGADPDSTGQGSSTGATEFDCSAIPTGPFSPVEQFMPAVFMSSEDLAFDGLGNLAGKAGNLVRLVDAEGTEVASYEDMGQAYGLRYRSNGDLLVAHFMSGIIVQIEPDGTRSNFASGYPNVNGLYPDLQDRIWLTDFATVGRINADGTYQDIVTGNDATTANGIVYDPDRGFAFFTNYGQGRIRKVAIDDAGEPGAVTEVAVLGGALMDGLSLDVCGNLYAVDQGGAQIYRITLDADAEAVGVPEALLDSNIANIANAQFGRGGEFDELSLYAAGTPGVVYRVEVGVPGAEIPLP